MNKERGYYTQTTTGLHYPIGDLYGYPDSLIRGRTGAAYFYGLNLIDSRVTSVLDFGSGRGHGVKMIYDKLSPKIIISGDIHLPYLKAQNMALTTNGQDTSYSYVNLSSRLPFQSSSIDIVTAMHVIEHITDPQSLAIELNRILKSDGKLLLATPDVKHLAGQSPFDEHVFTVNEITDLLGECGFNSKVFYICADQTALKVHDRKKWLAKHTPITAKIRNHVSPKIWEPLVIRSGISKHPLSTENFYLSENDSQNAIDILIAASKN